MKPGLLSRAEPFRPILGSIRRSRRLPDFRLGHDIGLEKQRSLESNPGAFFCDRSYDQTVTAGACFSIFLHATVSRKSLKTFIFNICEYSVKVALLGITITYRTAGTA